MKMRTGALLVLAAMCAGQTGVRKGIDQSYLDPTCKPCSDFYRYATGGWTDKNPIPPNRAAWGTSAVLQEANQERERTILQASAAAGMAGDQKQIGDFYSACMNTAAIDAAGPKPIQPFLDRIEGIRTRQELVAVLVSMELDDGLSGIRIMAIPDPDNAEAMITDVNQHNDGLSLPNRDYYFRDDLATVRIRTAFQDYVAKVEQLYGATPETASLAAKTVMDFETTLARPVLTEVQQRTDPHSRFHKMDFVKLKELALHFDWESAFRTLKISSSIDINVEQPELVKVIDHELADAPIETWKTWLRWRALDYRAQYLAKPTYDAWFHFHNTVLSGVTEEQPRWKVCVAQADSTLGDTLGRLYIDKYFPPVARRRVAEMVANLRSALEDELKTANWLTPETKKNALLKMSTFDARIGGTTKGRDYRNVHVARGSYLAAKESAWQDRQLFEAAQIGKPKDHTQWIMTPPTVNAYYSPEDNSITFPAGILQPPFFDAHADDAVNYGAIGAVIGHEMGHGFDDNGSQYDAHGNLKNWWTDQDRANFEERAACVTNLFQRTDVGGGQHHNGKLVTGEAMGDLGGLTVAYRAYHKSLGGKEAPLIDGFTGDQRFFIAFARLSARNIRDQEARRLLATNAHPLPKFRTNLTVRNMPEFQKAFGCAERDVMFTPTAQQCKLW